MFENNYRIKVYDNNSIKGGRVVNGIKVLSSLNFQEGVKLLIYTGLWEVFLYNCLQDKQ